MPRDPSLRYALPVRQSRSGETLERLLVAAEAVLAEDGLDGATVPVIARRAGVSVGIVYRRFPDKDALFRAVYERFFGSSREKNRGGLDPSRWEGQSLSQIATALITGMVEGYREKRGLIRALVRYADTHPDPGFRRRADRLNAEAFGAMMALLASRKSEVIHPEPEAAIEFALLLVAHAVRGFVLNEGPAKARFAGSDARMAREMVRAFLAYLGSPPLPRGRRSSKTRAAR